MNIIVEFLIKIDQFLINAGLKQGVKLNLDLAKLIKKISAQMLAEKLYFILPNEGKIKPNASHINNGCCAEFAKRLLEHIDGEYVWRVEFGIPHAFVLYKDRYYDSETPYGVSNWENLPIWKEHFQSGRINFDNFDELAALKELEKKLRKKE
jgi:hypothetical protein